LANESAPPAKEESIEDIPGVLDFSGGKIEVYASYSRGHIKVYKNIIIVNIPTK
jgi:hypothetical protein